MTTPSDDNFDVNAALDRKFRAYDAVRDLFTTQNAADVPLDARSARVMRVKSSHRGIGERKALKVLVADAVNQDFLDEICTITGLERLDLGWPVTAHSLDGLRALKRLRHLEIDSPRNITDFTPVLHLPALKTLFIENARHMTDIEWLRGADHLEVLGIEGSMWTYKKIASLEPLAGLKNLRAFFAATVRLADKNLFPLAECPRLEYLTCARFAPREEFELLQRLKPGLACPWFDPDMWRTVGQ